jgi:hypothetical protein
VEVRVMAADAVPASSSPGPTFGATWFRLTLRIILALLALLALALAADRLDAWMAELANFQRAPGLWLSWIGATVAAGILFGLATSLPFSTTGVRYAWSRLLLAAIALVPIAQYWWVFLFQLGRHHEAGGWLARADWLMDPWTQSVLAALAGVAIASGFRARTPEGPPGEPLSQTT